MALLGSHVLRTKNIHCALRVGAFPFSEQIRRARIVLGLFLSRFTVGMRRVYRALLGSHALRTKNIHCLLCFGAFTILERGTYILSSAFSLSCFRTPKSTVYVFRRYRALTLWERRIFVMFCASGHSRFQREEHAFSLACLSLQPFSHGWYNCLSSVCKYLCSSPIVRLVNHCFTSRTSRGLVYTP